MSLPSVFQTPLTQQINFLFALKVQDDRSTTLRFCSYIYKDIFFISFTVTFPNALTLSSGNKQNHHILCMDMNLPVTSGPPTPVWSK